MTVARAFGDPNLTPDDFSSFSKQEISADAQQKGLEQLLPIPPVRSREAMDLASVIGQAAVTKIQSSGKIVFHTAGDSGGVIKPEFQFAVADAMTNDLANGVAFFYHLGDVVYYFGQDQYYFEQFYDPYRNYNAPIFAIPGNHDAVVFRGESEKSLEAFQANFCTPAPTLNPDRQGCVRTTMDQPGVYFTFNAPFVKFIGLYSNTGEGPTQGVIANSKIGNAQLDFLSAQLAAAKAERAAGQNRALVIATHHPPFTSSPFHVPSPTMLKQIDAACAKAGIWPDIHLSGHSHLYERYTRTVSGKQIPYVVAGTGGFYDLAGLKPGRKPSTPAVPASGTDAGGNPLRFDVYNDTSFGFLRMTVSAASMMGEFVSVDTASGRTSVADCFVVDLRANTVSACSAATKSAAKSVARAAARQPKPMSMKPRSKFKTKGGRK
jgi:Calcineurin-like phosphoesterase